MTTKRKKARPKSSLRTRLPGVGKAFEIGAEEAGKTITGEKDFVTAFKSVRRRTARVGRRSSENKRSKGTKKTRKRT